MVRKSAKSSFIISNERKAHIGTCMCAHTNIQSYIVTAVYGINLI